MLYCKECSTEIKAEDYNGDYSFECPNCGEIHIVDKPTLIGVLAKPLSDYLKTQPTSRIEMSHNGVYLLSTDAFCPNPDIARDYREHMKKED